jgi:hypothetical protein
VSASIVSYYLRCAICFSVIRASDTTLRRDGCLTLFSHNTMRKNHTRKFCDEEIELRGFNEQNTITPSKILANSLKETCLFDIYFVYREQPNAAITPITFERL